MNETPLVSVIIPAFNASAFIGDTLRSVLDQHYSPLEIIVVNDGSTDDTEAVIGNFIGTGEQNGKTIRLISQQNKGASSAKQSGFERSAGDFIQYLDADDLLSPAKIGAQVQQLLEQPGKVACCGTRHFFDGDDPLKSEVIDEPYAGYPGDPLYFLVSLYGGFDRNGGMISPNAFLVPREIAEKAGGWDLSLSPAPDEDGEYFCRIILASKGVLYTPGAYTFYRKFRDRASLSAFISEQGLRNLVKSNLLKHKHLLEHRDAGAVRENIHRATFRSLNELRMRAYPQYPDLSTELSRICAQLDASPGDERPTFGGSLINWIGRNIHWKVARVLQYWKQRMK